MKFSVVIPTYKRKEILQRCLESFQKQNFNPENFEIIIVDDDQQQETEEIINNFKKKIPFLIRYFSQAHMGQGVARNKGIAEAQGKIIIFIGDDIFSHPDFLKEHARMHDEHPAENEAVLGLTLWHPDLTITPLMDFMTRGRAVFGKLGGHQFAYDLLDGKKEANFRFFYTSNISLKRSILLRHSFDPAFSGYGWEDIEFGYRLKKHEGLRIFYNPNAIGYHYHPMRDEDFGERMRNIGKSLHIFDKKHPELRSVPSGKKKFLLWLMTNPFAMRFLQKGEKSNSENFRNLYYYALSKKYFMEGLKESGK